MEDRTIDFIGVYYDLLRLGKLDYLLEKGLR